MSIHSKNRVDGACNRWALRAFRAVGIVGIVLLAGAGPVRAQPHRQPTPTPPGPTVDKVAQAKARKLFLEGRKHYRLRRFRMALKFFSEAYELTPLAGFMFNIGQCHRFLGNLEKAIFSYSQYVRDNPGTPDALFVERLIRRLKKRLQAESQKREKAQQLYEEGRKRLNLNQFREALNFFTRAYKAFPLPGYLYNIAEAHRGLKQCAEAIPFYRNYLRENPAAPRSKQVHARIKQCRQQVDKERKRRHHQDRLNKAIKGTGRRPVTIRSKPFYKKWWFWTAVAAGVGAAVGLGVGLGLREKPAELPVPALGTYDGRR